MKQSLFVTIKLHFTLHQTQSSMKEPNTLELIVTLFEKRVFGEITIDFVNSINQLVNVFTKSLRGPRIEYICNKLGAYDIYAPT